MRGKDLTISILLDAYGALLTERQRELVDLYYNEDLSLAEISENTGITRQGVRDGIKKSEVFLRECEEKLKEVADVSSRCIPFGHGPIGDKCVCCGREAKKLVYWGKAY